MSTQTLSELAKTIRSKNAGVDKITFDVIFRDRDTYERVQRSRVLTRESVAALYRIPLERITDFVEFDPAYAIKFTIYRQTPERQRRRRRHLRHPAIRAAARPGGAGLNPASPELRIGKETLMRDTDGAIACAPAAAARPPLHAGAGGDCPR